MRAATDLDKVSPTLAIEKVFLADECVIGVQRETRTVGVIGGRLKGQVET